MKLITQSLTILFLLGIAHSFNAQITVTGGLTAQQLAEILAGSNITVSNATITGPALGYGSFTSTNGFQFSSGVILSNGEIANAVGPNDDPNTSDNLGGAGTQQMTDLGGASSSDVVTLEFDFVVQSAGVQFKYLFASEDYPEFAPPNNPSFNDVFAFYISGPGIIGEENIALVPSTLLPVTISNINPVTNNQYYWDNAGGSEIQFDGGTVEMVALRNGLTPCSTYHLKLVIADIHNANRNSAVFLKENSFVQENVLGAETQTINSDGVALEGCVKGRFEFEYTDISTQDRTINFTIGGSAVNGVDYAYLDNYITIPAGETSGTVYIDAFSDGLTEGAETVTLTYNSGICIGTETVVLTINDAQPINFTLDGTNLDCFEDNSGEILVNATGGFPPYSFVVTSPDGITSNYSTNPITGLASGQYSVQVNDTYGCKAEALVIGGQFNAGTTFLPDGNGVTYQAPLVISGFNAGQTIANVNQIQQICLTMEHSYLGDLWIRVQSPSGQTITLKQQNGGGSCDLGEPIATGPVDGSGSSDTTPGVGYEYCFNAAPTHGTMVNESGSFTRNYVDGVGNAYSDTYLPAGSYTADESFSGLLGSQMNGTWKVFVTDQFGLDNGYIFNWYISLIGDLPDTIVTLTEPQEITISGVSTNATCGSNNGSINVNVMNGVAPVTYSWSNGAITEDLVNIGAGQYTLTVTDGNGCQKSETFIINNSGTLDLTANVTNVSCFGGNNGSIAITPSGGTAPVGILWSNGSTTPSISSLIAGNYSVTLTDQLGCQYIETITVGQGAQITATAVSLNDEICNTTNGSIDITATGGNGSYGYVWSNGAITQDLSNLNSGSYSVSITDGLGCTGTGTFSISNNLTGCSNFCYLDVEPVSTVNSTCGSANGAINISILNGVQPYTINWSNNAITEDITSLLPGTYSVTVVDNNNCSSTESITIQNVTNGLTISSVSVSDETCGFNNGSINITVAGGTNPLTYLWSNGAQTQDISNLSEGVYTVTISDASSCSLTASYTVGNVSGSLQINGQVSPAFCSSNNGSINQTVLNSNGNVTFLWNTGATTQNLGSLAPGTYTCTATDASGCSITNSYTVGQSTGNISLDGVLVTNEVCNNNQGAINITVTGNSLTYLWSNGTQTQDITGLSSGNYSCVISNAQGCSVNTGMISVINSAGNLVVSNQSIIDETCNGINGSADISVFGGQAPFTYNWSNGAITQDLVNIPSGIYTLQLSDLNGCTLAHSVTIEDAPGTLAISNSVLTHETCSGGIGSNGQGSINLTVTGGTLPYTYLWSNGAITEDLSGLVDGTYTVTINSANGCTLTQSFTILANGSNIAITSASVSDENCGSGTGSINISMAAGSGPYSYSWSNGATSEDIQNLSAGTYTLTVSNTSGCQLSQAFMVNNDAGTLSVVGNITDETCGDANGAINVGVQGGTLPYIYSWSNSSMTEDLVNISAGNYSLVVEDQFGCSVSYSGTVQNIANGLSVQITNVTNDNCGQGLGAIDATATGTGTLSYLWNNGAITEDQTAIQGGTYTLTVTDPLGCSASASTVVLNQTGTLAISFSNIQNETCGNDQGFIDIEVNGTGPLSYSWSNGQITQDIVGLSSGNYTVTITDGLGCQLSQTFTISNINQSLTTFTTQVTDAYCSSANGAIDLTVTGGITPFTYSWSNGPITQDIQNVAAGTYQVTITDGVNCQSSQFVTVGSQNSGLGFTFLAINNDFCNQGQGQITIYTGGTADNYFIDGIDNGGPDIFGLSEGTYTLTITDNFGCSVDSIVQVENDAMFNLSAVAVDASCGLSNGSINLSVVGGGPGTYTYSWSNGANTQDLTNIPAGTYTCTVSTTGGPGGGCSDNITVVVNNDVDYVINGTVSNDYCGQGTGSIDQVIVSGSGMTYLWSNGATTEDLTTIEEGTYTCTVSLIGGCTETYTYNVGNNTNGTIVNANIQNEICTNGQGSINLIITQGSGNFSFDWSNSETSQNINGLSAGVYSVIITDLNDGCIMNEMYSVSNQINSFGAIGMVQHSTCATCADGFINVVIGNSSSFTFDWSNGATTEDIFSLNPGTYSLTITSAAGCDTTMTFNVLNTASIEEELIENLEMTVFPNPAKTSFLVSISEMVNFEGKLVVTDIIGKIVEVRNISESGTFIFNTNNMNDGVYFITFTNGKRSIMERIVISNE